MMTSWWHPAPHPRHIIYILVGKWNGWGQKWFWPKKSDQSHAWRFQPSMMRMWERLRSPSDLISLNRVNAHKCRTWKEMWFNPNENLYRTKGKREGEGRRKAFLTGQHKGMWSYEVFWGSGLGLGCITRMGIQKSDKCQRIKELRLKETDVPLAHG